VKPAHHLLRALPLALVAAVLLWIGDMHLTQHDWVVGVAIFSLGLVVIFFCVRELRRGGFVR
jgi:hypothetical protein